MKSERLNKDEKQKHSEPAWWQSGVSLFLHLNVWIIFPILSALFLGKFLDKRFDTEPYLLLVCVFFSLIVSSVAIVVEGTKAMNKVDRDVDSKKDK